MEDAYDSDLSAISKVSSLDEPHNVTMKFDKDVYQKIIEKGIDIDKIVKKFIKKYRLASGEFIKNSDIESIVKSSTDELVKIINLKYPIKNCSNFIISYNTKNNKIESISYGVHKGVFSETIENFYFTFLFKCHDYYFITYLCGEYGF